MDEQNLSGGAMPDFQQPVAPEKTLTQAEVNAIVAREKQAAASRARQEAEREYQQKMEQMQMQQQQHRQAPQMEQQERGGYAPSEAEADAIYQQVQERFNREMQERQFQQEMTNVANSYHAKMDHGRKAYSDFDEVTKDFDPTSFPQLIYLVSGLENAGDIIYDLSRNPSKLATLDLLAQRSPRLAHAELAKLSGSISQNNMARKEAEQGATLEPLSPLQPSRVSGSGGQMNIRDLRSQPWLRG
jgi:hypothetical protein